MRKTWIFTSSRPLTGSEANAMKARFGEFVLDWAAHENKLKASVNLVDSRLWIVEVDESVYQASGCSIDKLTRFVKTLEKEFDITLLNRLLVAYKRGERIEVCSSGEVRSLLASGTLTPETTVLNTAASNDEELRHWEQPLKETWLSKFL